MKGLDLIKRQQPEFINDFPTGNICIGVTEEELIELEKELTDYQEIKEIAKRYKWDDIVSEIYNVNTDKKYRDLFNSAIEIIQEDYNKARVLEIIKKIGIHETEIILCVDYDTYCEMRKKPIPEEEFNKIKRFLS